MHNRESNMLCARECIEKSYKSVPYGFVRLFNVMCADVTSAHISVQTRWYMGPLNNTLHVVQLSIRIKPIMADGKGLIPCFVALELAVTLKLLDGFSHPWISTDLFNLFGKDGNSDTNAGPRRVGPVRVQFLSFYHSIEIEYGGEVQ